MKITLNRKGVTRNVILIGRYVIKIPTFTQWNLFLHGLLGNMNEKIWWKNSGDLRLCPVLWSCPGGFLNIMARAREVTVNEYLGMSKKYMKNYFDTIPVEIKPSSFGWIDRRLVAIDYG